MSGENIFIWCWPECIVEVVFLELPPFVISEVEAASQLPSRPLSAMQLTSHSYFTVVKRCRSRRAMGVMLRPNTAIMMNTERLVAEIRQSLRLANVHSWINVEHFSVVDGTDDDDVSA